MERSLKVVPTPATATRAAHPVEAAGSSGLIRIAVASGAAVVAAVVAILWAWPIGEPEKLGTLQGDAWEGAYLARASGCVACHTAPGSQALAGGAPIETPFGTFVPPNITPDPEGGIGNWTLDEFAVAVRQGVSPEGHAYYPAFVYEFYRNFSDQDVADLFAALQSVPPVAEPAAPHDVSFPFNLRFGLKLWRAAFLSEPYVTPVLGRSELWNRGQALVEGAAHCAACHTGRNLLGGLEPDERMAGSDALPGGGVAPSLRRDDLLARGWTPANLAYALRTAVAPDGDALGGAMAEAIHQGTSYLDEADREAIAAYLLDVDEIDAPQASAVTAASEMEGMAGMDHAAMMAAPDTAVSPAADESAESTSVANQSASSMEGMDHSAMVMEPSVDTAVAESEQNTVLERPGLRPQPRPESQ